VLALLAEAVVLEERARAAAPPLDDVLSEPVPRRRSLADLARDRGRRR
jgi:hypothetical protein